MGIRESLEQSIEHEDLNLKDFVMPEDEKDEGGFDFEKEIGERDFELMKSALEKSKLDEVWSSYIHLAYEIKIVFPENMDQIDLGNGTLQNVAFEFRHDKLTGCLRDLSSVGLAVNMKILCSDCLASLNVDSEEIEIKLKSSMQKSLEDRLWSFFISYASGFKIFSPEKFEEVDFERSVLIGVEQELVRYRKQRKWERFFEIAGNAKIVFSESFSNIELLDKEWLEIKKLLDSMREDESELYYFCGLLGDLKIFLAKEVNVTDHGLEIIMPEKSFKPEKLKRPERRAY